MTQPIRPHTADSFDNPVYAVDRSGNISILGGNTVPTATTPGYAKGCIFQQFDGSAGTMLYVNNGTAASCLFEAVPTAGASGAAAVGITDAGGFTAATNVEAALAELFQNLFSVRSFISLPINSWREAVAFDVLAIAGNGGILGSDTTPVLSAINDATDGCQRMLWVSSNNDQIVTQIPLPPDLDDAADIVLHARVASGGTSNAVGFVVASYFDEGDTAVADTTTTNQTTAYVEVTATIAAADVPAGAQTLTIGLTPAAHTTDTLACTAIWLEYKKKLLVA